MSCSNYVFNITESKGLISGIKAFNERFKSCKPGYLLFEENNQWYLKTVNDIIVKQEYINPKILIDYIVKNDNIRRE